MWTVQGEDPRVSAIFRALAAGDHAEAISLVEQHWSYVSSFRLEVKRAVADSLPDEVLAARPGWAAVKASLAHTFLGRLRPTVWSATLPPLPPDASLFDRVAVHTALAISARSTGRLEEALRRMERARRELQDAPPGEAATVQHAMCDLHYEWGLVALYAGRRQQALELFEQSFDWAERREHPRAAINAAAELAWLAVFAGRRGEALGWLRVVDQIRAEHPTVQHTRSTERIARAQLLLDELDLPEARAELDAVGDAREHELLVCAVRGLVDAHDPERDPGTTLAQLQADAEAFHDGWSSARLNASMIGVARGRLHQREGHPERALQALRGATPDNALLESGPAAAALYQLGDLDRAYATAMRALAQPDLWPRMRIDAMIVAAAVALRRGDAGEASATFAEAVEHAAENRMRVALAILPADVLQDLADLLADDHAGREFVRQVVTAPIAFPAPAEAARLTARERTVLLVLAEGRTVAQAAQQLTVSANTIKTQLRSLYRKLGVHDRKELVMAARRRGLL